MIVVVLVALGQAADPSTQSLTAAAQDGLGPAALVVVREAPPESLATHADSERTGELLHADAVATVEWNDDAHEHAHVAVYLTRDHAWQDRSVTFASADASTERGRQIGYGIAAMVPPPSMPPAPENPPPRETVVTKPIPNPMPRFAADVAGIGASGVAGGFGGELAARVRVWRSLWLRAGYGMRFGSISAADSSFTDARVDFGPALVLVSIQSLDLGARADFVLTRIGVSRDASLVNASGSHWVSGTDLLIEGALGLARDVAIVAGAGAELDFGATKIVVDGTEVDHAAEARALAEFGVRVRF